MERMYTEKPIDRKRNRPLKNYAGVRFGRLTGLKLVERDITYQNNHRWSFVCDCGTEKVLYIKNVRSGNTSSCGCLAKEILIKRNTIHGLSKDNKREYRSWKDMRARCLNKNDTEYHNYGGRGIVFIERWDEFPNFLADMGNCPAGNSIDRIDVNGNYEPINCRWATSEVQANNKRCTPMIGYKGREQTLSQWCREYKIERSKVSYRLKQGLPLDAALTKIDLRKREPIGNVV